MPEALWWLRLDRDELVFCHSVVKWIMQSQRLTSAHRGAPGNPANRFDAIQLEPDADWNPEEDILPRTQFLVDHSQTAITRNHSPDLPFPKPA